MSKKLKKLIVTMLVLVMSFAFTIIVNAEETEKLSLGEMSEEQCLETLVEYGMEIPEAYKEYPDLAGFVKKIVDSVLVNPERTSWYNYTAAQDFALIIRETVLGYSDITYGFSVPSYTSGYRVIALRKCSEDYHFMYLHSASNVWQHKPSHCTPMIYNYSSLTSGKWTNEGVLYGTYNAGTLEYNSDIIYIRYKLK